MTAPLKWLPQFFPRSWEDERGAFGIAFTEDIALGFVTREHGGYSYLLKTDARERGSRRRIFSPEL
jgi:hypothetical protein